MRSLSFWGIVEEMKVCQAYGLPSQKGKKPKRARVDYRWTTKRSRNSKNVNSITRETQYDTPNK